MCPSQSEKSSHPNGRLPPSHWSSKTTPIRGGGATKSESAKTFPTVRTTKCVRHHCMLPVPPVHRARHHKLLQDRVSGITNPLLRDACRCSVCRCSVCRCSVFCCHNSLSQSPVPLILPQPFQNTLQILKNRRCMPPPPVRTNPISCGKRHEQRQCAAVNVHLKSNRPGQIMSSGRGPPKLPCALRPRCCAAFVMSAG